MASSVFKNIRATKTLGDLEIDNGIQGNRSWHHQYRHSAYIYIGGLKDGMTEGDTIVVFSQFGEIVDCHMVRDKKTGKSKGFCFVCYEDQKSTDLAVDNMNGYVLLGRTLRVDHVDKFKVPKKFDEEDLDENGDPKLLKYEASGAEGKGVGQTLTLDSTKNIHEVTQARDAKLQRETYREDHDEAWARAFEESLTKQKSDKDQKKLEKKLQKQQKKKEKKEKKKAKKEAKKALKKEKTKKQLKAIIQQAKAESSSDSSDDDDDDSSASSDDKGKAPATNNAGRGKSPPRAKQERGKSPSRERNGRGRSPPRDGHRRGRSPSMDRGGRRREDSRKRTRR